MSDHRPRVAPGEPAVAGADAGSEPRPLPNPIDVALLGLQIEPGVTDRFSFVLEPHLCRRDGILFGGAALSASLTAFELVAQRPALWSTVQFVASAAMGEVLTCEIASVARGRAVDQLQVTATVGDRLIFTALGAAAAPRAGGISGLGPTMPAVAPVEACERFGVTAADAADAPEVGHYLVSDFLETPLEAPSAPGHLAMWARVTGQPITTAAKLAFLADMVPIAVCRAAGVQGAGTSLDNSLRIGQLVDTEWVLVELQAHTAHGGFGYGICHLWSPDGTLMATGSQTAKLFSFESFLAAGR